MWHQGSLQLPLLRSLPGDFCVTSSNVSGGDAVAAVGIPRLWVFPSPAFSGVSWCHTGHCDGSHQPAPGPGLCHHEEDAHPFPHQPARESCLPCSPSQGSHTSGGFLPGNAVFCSAAFRVFQSTSLTRLLKVRLGVLDVLAETTP